MTACDLAGTVAQMVPKRHTRIWQLTSADRTLGMASGVSAGRTGQEGKAAAVASVALLAK
ncbi:MAG: hypothetical protein LKI80_00950 [Sporolactobacillus sp.]|nr:hypothetical protein [Sporolactobacillus sp.]